MISLTDDFDRLKITVLVKTVITREPPINRIKICHDNDDNDDDGDDAITIISFYDNDKYNNYYINDNGNNNNYRRAPLLTAPLSTPLSKTEFNTEHIY